MRICASLPRRIFIAVSLFCSCERSFWIATTVLVGKCVMRTAESVVLTLWPPWPPLRYTSIFRSLSSITTSSGASISGIASTSAKLVWRKLSLLNGLRRTSRWTPCSPRSLPYAYSPRTLYVAFFMPASSPVARSISSTDMPAFSAHRRYIRSNISVQSCASVPPAPALNFRIAAWLSNSPLKRSVFRNSA